MAINPIQYGGVVAPQALDFTPLAQLGQVYQQGQAQRAKQQALSQLGQGSQADVNALLQSGDMSLAQLGLNLQQRQQDQERQARLDARQLSRDATTDKQNAAYLSIAQRAANRAEADAGRPTIKEVTLPDGSTALFSISRDGSAPKRLDLGLPPSNGTSQNPKSPFNQALLKADAERVNDYTAGGKQAEEGIATLDQIDALRGQAYTAPLIGPLAARVGHPATQALETSTNALALDVAQKMKGSLSDKDIAFVKSQVPTAATGGAAGETASGAIRAGFERSRQRADFYRTWAEQNGNINGADVAWRRYIDENPMTVQDKKALGGRRFNPEFNRDFKPYLKGGAGRQQGISEAQYNALPSGSVFTAPDGTQRVKP